MNVEWAIAQLGKFIELTTPEKHENDDSGYKVFTFRTMASYEEVTSQFLVVKRILDRSMPDWKDHSPQTYSTGWDQQRIAAIHARELLSREEEIQENLGDDSPRIAASELHHWIWGGASSLWQSGHYAQAVDGAIKKLNAEAQNKLGRRDVSEVDLFKQAFTLDAPQHGKPRFRRMENDGSKTYRNLHLGAMNFADGIFTAIRNFVSHEADIEIAEQEALEYLAALSVLARWVDEATVERTEDTP